MTRIYCKDTGIYLGLLWSRRHPSANWVLWWWAEDRQGDAKRFNNEEAARDWLDEQGLVALRDPRINGPVRTERAA